MPIALLQLSATVYAIAAFVVILHIAKPSEAGARRGMSVIISAVVFHALAVGGRIVELSAFPLADAHDALSLT